ncbi:MAG: hypothetical protein E7472_03230 [Ruminococcaceae bacterium]|nr:hypothetical protein [Oscillospiraceae bacterium]
MDFEKLEREMRATKGLGEVADSPEGKRLASQLDGAALSDAVKRGDAEALKNMLGRVLATPEGRALAEKVQKAVGNK